MAFSMIISVKSLTEDDFTKLFQGLLALLKVNNLEGILSIQKINTIELSPIITKIELEPYWISIIKNLTEYNVILITYKGNMKDTELLKFKKKNKGLFYENEYFHTRTPRLLKLLEEIVAKNKV
jgi:hypothetical protein